MVVKSSDAAADRVICADIWLESSLAAHDFIPACFWRAQRQAMIDRYLPVSTVYLAVNGERVAGFAALNGSVLAALFVRPEDQGLGAGRALMGHLFDRHEKLFLSVYLKNHRAIVFYERLGFVPGEEDVCPHTGELERSMVWHKKTPVLRQGSEMSGRDDWI